MRRAQFLAPLVAALAAPAIAQGGEADGADDDDFAIPASAFESQIVVTGNALPVPLSDRAYSIETVPLDDPLGDRVENTLRDVPGLQQFRRSDARSANPTSQGLTLRGLGGNASSRALVTLDGVPQADPFGGWISWPGYDALDLAVARVKRGGGSVADGPGAIAGTIELVSPERPHPIGAGLAYGSRNAFDAKLKFGPPTKTGSFLFSGSYARGDGFLPIVKGQRGSVDRRADYEQAGLATRFLTPISGSTDLQFMARAFSDNRERGFRFSDNQNRGADASVRLVSEGADRDAWQWSALAYIQLREFATRFGSVADDRNSVDLVLDQYNVPSTGLGARAEVRPPVGGNLELRLGADWRRTVGETNEQFLFSGLVPTRGRNAGGATDTAGGFAELGWQAGDALALTLGGRVDRWWISDGFFRQFELGQGGAVLADQSFAERSGWEPSGRVGIAFDAGDGLAFRGAAYSGWRLPTLNELYRPFRVGADATAANAALSPERVYGGEIGMDWEGKTLSFGATLFANRLDNAIANVTLDQGPGVFPGVGFVSAAGAYRQRQNLDAIDSKGVELDATARFDAITLSLGYAYVDAEVDGSEDAAGLDGLRPAQVPRHFAIGSVEYSGEKFGFGAKARYVSSQFEDDFNSFALDDAFTLDAWASVALMRFIDLKIRAENLFDERVEASTGSDGVVERTQPRTIWIGIRAGI